MSDTNAPPYRVGNHQPQNIYCGDTYIGVMFDPAHAARVVDVLNRTAAEVGVPDGLTDAVYRWVRVPGEHLEPASARLLLPTDNTQSDR